MNNESYNPFLYENGLMDFIPAMRYSAEDDFEKWQELARIKLKELFGFLYMKECDSEFSVSEVIDKHEYEEIHFTYQSEPGYYVPACILKPRNLPQPMKTVICLQGHSTGMHISYGVPKYEKDPDSIAGDRDFAVRAVKEGYAAVCIEQRYMGSCGSNDIGKPACSAFRASLPALILGRCAVGERVWDVMRLIDVIEEHFDYIDSEEIMCLGNSGGGTVSFYAACMDERIKCTVPSCSLCTFKDSIGAMSHCACNYIPGIARYFDMGDLAGLIAPRKLVLACGRQDGIFPYEGVKQTFSLIKEYYKAAASGDNCVMVTGDEGHRFYADITWQAIHKLNEN